jgi:hypothetical protein
MDVCGSRLADEITSEGVIEYFSDADVYHLTDE